MGSAREIRDIPGLPDRANPSLWHNPRLFDRLVQNPVPDPSADVDDPSTNNLILHKSRARERGGTEERALREVGLREKTSPGLLRRDGSERQRRDMVMLPFCVGH